jgi:hypothetical protein
MAWRKLKLRWAAACVGCGSALPSGVDAWWDEHAGGRNRQMIDVAVPAGHAPVLLCFTVADLPLLGTLQVRGHLLLHRKPLVRRLRAEGPLAPSAIDALARVLAAALPSA